MTTMPLLAQTTNTAGTIWESVSQTHEELLVQLRAQLKLQEQKQQQLNEIHKKINEFMELLKESKDISRVILDAISQQDQQDQQDQQAIEDSPFDSTSSRTERLTVQFSPQITQKFSQLIRQIQTLPKLSASDSSSTIPAEPQLFSTIIQVLNSLSTERCLSLEEIYNFLYSSASTTLYQLHAFYEESIHSPLWYSLWLTKQEFATAMKEMQQLQIDYKKLQIKEKEWKSYVSILSRFIDENIRPFESMCKEESGNSIFRTPSPRHLEVVHSKPIQSAQNNPLAELLNMSPQQLHRSLEAAVASNTTSFQDSPTQKPSGLARSLIGSPRSRPLDSIRPPPNLSPSRRGISTPVMSSDMSAYSLEANNDHGFLSSSYRSTFSSPGSVLSSTPLSSSLSTSPSRRFALGGPHSSLCASRSTSENSYDLRTHLSSLLNDLHRFSDRIETQKKLLSLE